MGVIEIVDTDIVSLDEFPLRWRFTDRRADRWSVEARRRLRPLSAAAAATLAPRAGDAWREQGSFAVTFRSDDAPAIVRQKLRDLPPESGEAVLVSWDARTAAMTDWEVFVTHWDDFCYPSSDDVTVLPLTGTWVLCYRRYEVMQFSPRMVPNADSPSVRP